MKQIVMCALCIYNYYSWFERQARIGKLSLWKNYLFSNMPAGCLILEDGSTLSAWTYQSIHGPLYHNGAPMAFKNITAENRIFPEYNQEECLRKIYALWNTDASFEDWILNIAQNDNLRSEATSKLKTLCSRS